MNNEDWQDYEDYCERRAKQGKTPNSFPVWDKMTRGVSSGYTGGKQQAPAASDAGSGADVTDPAEQLKWARLALNEADKHIQSLQAQLAAAEEALRRCINADVVGYWSAEEVAQRYFAAQEKASDSP